MSGSTEAGGSAKSRDLSVDEARDRILAGLRPTSAEVVPIAGAWHV